MRKFFALGAFAAATLLGCGGGGDSTVTTPTVPNTPYTASAIVDWNTVAIDAIRSGTLGPPAVARALGIIHTATFDAWAAYDAKAVAVMANAPAKRPASDGTDANKNAAIGMAAYRALVNLYPAQKDKFDSALKARGLAPESTSTTDGSAAAVGNAAAAAVLAFRANDGANQANGYADTTAYKPTNTATDLVDPSAWQPQTFCNGRTPGYLLPHWGTIAPFALATGNAVRPQNRPAILGDAKFTQQALDVIAISAGLDERQKVIAEYWADGPASETPPGHWFLFAQATSKFYRHSVDQDAMMYMAMGNAMLDASIATWDAKRAYNSARPISAIRHVFKGQQIKSWVKGEGVKTVMGEQWSPYQACTFVTPPFPEFTSGHSAFSAAGAEILKRYTGSDFNPYTSTVKAGTMTIDTNMPSQDVSFAWPTFTVAADEAGMSRRYGGIHFEDGDLSGRELGRKVAEAVWKKSTTHFGR